MKADVNSSLTIWEPESDEMGKYHLYAHGNWQRTYIRLPQEQTLSLFVNGQELVSILCTPDKLNCLVIGFLRSEGLITSTKDIVTMRICLDESLADVRLSKQTTLPTKRTITSGCGGGTIFDQATNVIPVNSNWQVTPQQILSGMRLLQSKSRGSLIGGGIRKGMHVSALSDGEKVIVLAEDIGRHNTLDKIWGECILTGEATADRFLVTTGRITSEMLLKVAKMEVPLVASLNSATQRAVELGNYLGVTVVGYVRSDKFSVYTHPYHILGYPTTEQNVSQS